MVPHPDPASPPGEELWQQFSPWAFWREADAAAQAEQLDLLARIRERGHALGDDVFVSPLAAYRFESFSLGDRSYLAAHTYLSGRVAIGVDCSVNPFCVVRGDVTIGDVVRIGAHTSILAFNHGMDDVSTPIFRQPHSSRGIRIGDDVWIGSSVTILDGVDVGSHSVIAAGAVVTKHVPDFAIVAGNPARVVRDRREPRRPRADGRASASRSGSASASLVARLAEFADRARSDAETVVSRSWSADRGLYSDAPGARPTVRAHCDAVEIADLLIARAPSELSAAEHIERLRSWQHESTGLVAELDEAGRVGPAPRILTDGGADYHVLCVGYALDLLGSRFAHSITAVTRADARELASRLPALDWREHAWGAGAHIDSLGTALRWTMERDASTVAPGFAETLFGWLALNADRSTGLWGSPTAAEGLLQPVNGFYRASRGTLAQFGVPIGDPRAVVDSVLRHSADTRVFAPGRETACDVLDVAHPLWFARRQLPEYRRAEVSEVAATLLERIVKRWVPGEGFAFAASTARAARPEAARPGLQGTEMWLATAWLLADLLGESDALGYRPRGVHRPEPALAPPAATAAR